METKNLYDSSGNLIYPNTYEDGVFNDADDRTLEDKYKKVTEFENDAPYVVDEDEYYKKLYFTIEALEDGTISFSFGYGVTVSEMASMSYSLDNGENWVTINNTDGRSENLVTTINVTLGLKVLWKGTGTNMYHVQNDNISMPPFFNSSSFYSSGTVNVYGNILSLLYNDNFLNSSNLNTGSFAFLFILVYNQGNDYLLIVNAENLILPFSVANYCYYYMFNYCASLVSAPKLPATTLASSCYGSMFSSCTSLTIAPELPATTLAEVCYAGMFYNCTNLNYIKALFTTTPSNTYTQDWVNGVASSGTFIKSDSATWDVTGVNGVPTDWNVYTESEYEIARNYQVNTKQDTLVSGTNIKTINGSSLLGSGDIVTPTTTVIDDLTTGGTSSALSAELGKTLNTTKLDTLVSGTNIKTINGESLLGSTDISTRIPIVNQTETTVEIQPNVLNVWGTVETLTITLATPTDNTITNEYMIQFTSGTTATTLSLPSSIKWVESPSIDTGVVCQISIINNLGIVAKFA